MRKGSMGKMGNILKGFKLWTAEEEVYCIAYGSNLCEERMKNRCPDSRVFGTSVIMGYRMLFKRSCTGYYATIEQDANCEVPVVIYKMSAMDEARLDRFEGYPRYYRKQEFLLPVWGLKGKKLKNRRQCIAYIMHEDRILGYPTHDYFRLIDEGYERWGFDKALLYKALSDSMGERLSKGWIKDYEKEKKKNE